MTAFKAILTALDIMIALLVWYAGMKGKGNLWVYLGIVAWIALNALIMWC